MVEGIHLMADNSVPDAVQARAATSLVLPLSGEIDLAQADRTVERGNELLNTATAGQRLVIDMQRVRFIDSSGLSGLLRLRRLAEQRGVAVYLRDVPEQIAGLLRLSGVDQVLPAE
jgi:anti-sigma B factor antagonist